MLCTHYDACYHLLCDVHGSHLAFSRVAYNLRLMLSNMFTLYVAPNKKRPTQHDVGSVLCMKTLQNIPDGVVQVLNCATLSTRPSFLRGTPTLVDDGTNEVYTGHHALHRLQLLSLYHAEQYGKAQASADRRRDGGGGRRGGPMPPPPSRPTASERDDDGGDISNMWESTIDEADLEEEAEQTLSGDRKLTSDDLSRALSDRTPMPQQKPTTAPPPPPPPLND